MARSQVATPSHLIDGSVYSELVRAGFRRSGAFTYRPYCDHCRACVPVRIVTEEFRPNRAQRRTLEAPRRAHRADARPQVQRRALRALPALPVAAPQRRRHGPGQPRAVPPLPAAEQRRLAADRVPRGRRRCAWCASSTSCRTGSRRSTRSSIPTSPAASFGTYNILWQIELCRKLDLPYLYLGYWIGQSRKMAYKIQFQPMQGLIDGQLAARSSSSDEVTRSDE